MYVRMKAPNNMWLISCNFVWNALPLNYCDFWNIRAFRILHNMDTHRGNIPGTHIIGTHFKDTHWRNMQKNSLRMHTGNTQQGNTLGRHSQETHARETLFTTQFYSYISILVFLFLKVHTDGTLAAEPSFRTKCCRLPWSSVNPELLWPQKF